MSGFHGTWLKTIETDDFVLTWTRFDSIGTLPPHTHRQAYASLVLRGSYTELHHFSPRVCIPGTLIVHNAGEVHADHFHERCVVVNAEPKRCHVTGEMFATAFTPFEPAFVVASSVNKGDRPVPRWIGNACALFNRESHLTPGQAAALVGRHPVDFSRAFRKYVGLTPGSFRRRVRIRRAVWLMMTSGLKLAQVAQECGFNDQSHFTHAFVRETGMPPQRFAAVFAC